MEQIISTNITVESRIYNPPDILKDYGTKSNTIYREIFNEILNNPDKPFKELQKEISHKHNILVRLFKSLYIKAKAQLTAQKELRKLYIKEKEDKIKETKIKRNKSRNPYKKHRLSNKLNKQEQLLHNLRNKGFQIVFGTKEFYKKQWNKDTDKTQWSEDWNRKRNHSLYFVGSKDETDGNSLCQMKSLNLLRLTLPNCYNQKYLNLEVNFNHTGKNYDLLKIARANGQALTYTILQKENKKWYVQVSFAISAELDENSYNGSIGIDLNYNLITTTSIKKDGNPDGRKDYHMNVEKWSSDRSTNEYSLIVNDMVERAKSENRFIVMEDLDLAKKRNTDSGKQTNRKVAMIATDKFYKLLLARCIKEKILLKLIDPAYTSVIGKYKYSKNLGISVHSSASLVIGRKGMNFRERIPRRILDELHSGENQLVKCESWKDVLKLMKKSYPRGFSLKRRSLKREHTNSKVNRSNNSILLRQAESQPALEMSDCII